MRRIVAVLAIGLLGAAALVLEPPPSRDPEPFVDTTVADDQPVLSRFSHCAWAFADGDVDTTFALATLPAVEYVLSFPQTGELSEHQRRNMPASSALGVGLGDIIQQGDAPAIVEFDAGPAAAAVVAAGDTEVAAASCPASLPKLWHLPGGSTQEGEEFTIRLMNPFADDARVDIDVTSELGAESTPTLQGLTIPSRSTRVVDVSEVLPSRVSLAISIEQIEGSVIPMAQIRTETGLAVWPATRPSLAWEFPLAGTEAGSAVLTLANASPVPVTYGVEVFADDGTVETLDGGLISGPGQAVIPIDELGVGLFGVRVTGDGPFSAAVTERTEGGFIAIAPGAPTVDDRWLLPGPNAEGRGRYRLWLMNSGVDAITVSTTFLEPAGPASAAAGQVEIPAGAVTAFPITDVGTAGMLIEGSGPFSVAWSVTSGDGIGFSSGTPLGE